MKKLKSPIPLLSPVIFKKDYIKNNTDELLNDNHISDFFIHSFKEDEVILKLPLPPHKKTVNDFVFVSQGSMTKSLGLESHQLQQNDLLFTPKNKITATEVESTDLEGYYCHFSDDFSGINPFLGVWSTQISSQNKFHVTDEEAQNWSIQTYANELNITPNHLNKLVKKETGKTTSEIIREITILEAKVLLLQTNLTINEISIELGYDDTSNFSRIFKTKRIKRQPTTAK